jgi:hypothetical protein
VPNTEPDTASTIDPEAGFLSLASLFAVLGLVIGFALLANIGKTIGQKLETQNAADAAATGTGIELARGMNMVTAANHLIGELHAIVVLHQALGGDAIERPRNAPRAPQRLQQSLAQSHQIARTLSQIAGYTTPIGYDPLRDQPEAGASLYDAMIELKKIMTWAYILHATGAIFKLMGNFPIPIVSQILTGIAYIILACALAFEGKAMQEWYTLVGVRTLARITSPMKQIIQWTLIPGLYGFTSATAGAVPGLPSPLPVPGFAAQKAEEAARELAEFHGAQASLFPGLSSSPSVPLLALPVVAEPRNLNPLERSQLIRAATPWIQHWRRPWLRFGEDAVLMSRFKCFYYKYTNEFTLEMTRRAKNQFINLLILRDFQPQRQQKGEEPWARESGSGTADRWFSTVAFAHRPPVGIAAWGYFRQPNPDGFLAFAQTMIYNANPQEADRSRAGFQRRVGWDTLNWANDVPEFPGPQSQGEGCSIPQGVPEPRIRLNWQAKLVPTTRLPEAVLWSRGPTREILRRTAFFVPGLTNTH